MTDIQQRVENFVAAHKAAASGVADIVPQPEYASDEHAERPVSTGGGYLQDMMAALVERVVSLEARIELLETPEL